MADILVAIEMESRSKTRADVSVRDFTFSIDEPETLGGTNAGPNPVQMLLGALAGCLNVLGHLVAKEMGFQIQAMRMRVEGNLDPLAYLGRKSDVRPGFKQIRVSMDVQSNATPEVLREWAKAVEARCPVSNNIEYATPVSLIL
jgi:uncharacterized OsmC-like protein